MTKMIFWILQSKKTITTRTSPEKKKQMHAISCSNLSNLFTKIYRSINQIPLSFEPCQLFVIMKMHNIDSIDADLFIFFFYYFSIRFGTQFIVFANNIPINVRFCRLWLFKNIIFQLKEEHIHYYWEEQGFFIEPNFFLLFS